MVQYISEQKRHITSTQLAVDLNLLPYNLHEPRLYARCHRRKNELANFTRLF